ncbi:MAG: Tim44 domain-containing protein [Alphaproteobacteria bacterium]|nr:Tim44 domain-containing protein [Alphaproteobacteria bacterium]
MSDGIPYADILILALVAGFILLRLRSVLGAKNEGDGPEFFKKDLRPAEPKEIHEVRDTVIQLDQHALKQKPREDFDPLLATITDEQKLSVIAAMKERDPQFTATAFADGATRAFEMVFDAFAKGDKPTLKMLLSDSLYDGFCGEIDARSSEDEKHETTLLSVKATDIAAVSLENNIAKITMRLESEQVTVVRDSSGAIVGGDASDVHHVQDEWVFERDVTSKSPNWKIIET